jgi:hypothetical protein
MDMTHRPLTALAIASWMAVSICGVSAQEQTADDATQMTFVPRPFTFSDVAAAIAAPAPMAEPKPRGSRAPSPLLLSLYASNAALQALDVHSTLLGIKNGAVEGNRFMAALTSNAPLFIATKAGVSAATIYAVSRIAKQNRAAAVATLVGINSVYAMVAAHNYRIAHGLR